MTAMAEDRMTMTEEKWPNWVTLLDTLLRLNSVLAKKQIVFCLTWLNKSSWATTLQKNFVT